MSMIEFAENELNILLNRCKDEESREMQEMANKDILDVIKVFAKQGHSGFSASYCLGILNRLMKYKPLTTITDNLDEWNKLDYDDDIAYQSKRCPQLFMDKDGRVYDVEAKVFSDDNGHTWFNSKDSREYVTLPYDVPEKSTYVIIDNNQARQSIMVDIINTIISLGGSIENSNDINEETDILSVLDGSKLKELEAKLMEKYNITKPLFTLEIKDEPKMWNVINFIQKSDKEESIKMED